RGGRGLRHPEIVPDPLHDHHRRPGQHFRQFRRRGVPGPVARPPEEHPGRPAWLGDRPCRARRTDDRRRADRDLPDRRTARHRPALAAGERETPALALPALRGRPMTRPADSRRPSTSTFGRRPMKKPFAALVAAAIAAATPALADLQIPNLSYRTGPYAPGGIPYADGF